MKVTGLKVAAKSFALAFVLNALGVQGAEPTAFELMREGDRDVGADAKDSVVQIRSEKSMGVLAPGIWFVVYCDARMKTTEVKFDCGKKLAARRPFHWFGPAIGRKTLLDLSRLKIDSDRALKIVEQDGLLDRVRLTNSRMTLENREEMPV